MTRRRSDSNEVTSRKGQQQACRGKWLHQLSCQRADHAPADDRRHRLHHHRLLAPTRLRAVASRLVPAVTPRARRLPPRSGWCARRGGRQRITVLADALLRHGTLSGEEIAGLGQQAHVGARPCFFCGWALAVCGRGGRRILVEAGSTLFKKRHVPERNMPPTLTCCRAPHRRPRPCTNPRRNA